MDSNKGRYPVYLGLRYISQMETTQILAGIDAEIQRLHKPRQY